MSKLTMRPALPLQTSYKLLIFAVISFLLCTRATVWAEDGDGLFSKIRQKYATLSPKGKFAAGCTVGFVGSRIAIDTAVKFIKVGVAAFVIAEVLHHTGVNNDLMDLSEEQAELFTKLKQKLLQETDKYRVQIRRSFSDTNIQKIFDNEKQAAFGLLSGALVATLL